jgi:acetamidase/formamidase
VADDYRQSGKGVRVLFCFGIGQNFFDAPAAEQRQLIETLPGVFADLDRRFGVKVIGAMDDDELMVGPSEGWPWTAYVLAEARDHEAVAAVCNLVRETLVGDTRLWKYMRVEARVGRSLFFIDEDASRPPAWRTPSTVAGPEPERLLGSPTARSPKDRGEDPPDIHRVVDNSIPPALTVASGEVVAFDCPGLPLPPEATVEDLMEKIDPDRPHTIVGPVEVSGAEPGDTLVVEILDIELLHGYGHTVLVPGEGLLGEEVSAPHVQNFAWEPGTDHAVLRPGVRVPFDPFCGMLGVMPAEPGEHATLPPRATGGNLDNRRLVPGAKLYLPVAVPGALFFAGDGHAAQGDGEVCITGLETSARATLRLSVEKDRRIAEPHFVTPAPLGVDPGPGGYYGTSSAGPDLYRCSQGAIRQMVAYLVERRGLSWEEALVLCSLAVDLQISEIVDRPNWMVSACLPLSVFEDA